MQEAASMRKGELAMPAFNTGTYGATFANLLGEQLAEEPAKERLPSLEPGQPHVPVGEELRNLTIETAFAGRAVRDRDMAALCLAGVWLRFGYLDESHRISQAIETP